MIDTEMPLDPASGIHSSFLSPTSSIQRRIHSTDSNPNSLVVSPIKTIPSIRPRQSPRRPTSHWCFVKSTGIPHFLAGIPVTNERLC